jgi:hypothetical protein
MPLIKARDKNGEEALVSDEWLTRWPNDFTAVKSPDSPKETTPATGTNKKEKA